MEKNKLEEKDIAKFIRSKKNQTFRDVLSQECEDRRLIDQATISSINLDDIFG
jgi:hypothetical protein